MRIKYLRSYSSKKSSFIKYKELIKKKDTNEYLFAHNNKEDRSFRTALWIPSLIVVPQLIFIIPNIDEMMESF